MNKTFKEKMVEGLVVASCSLVATVIANCLVNKSLDLLGKTKTFLTEKTPKEAYEDMFEE